RHFRFFFIEFAHIVEGAFREAYLEVGPRQEARRRRFFRPHLELLEERNGPTSLLATMGLAPNNVGPAIPPDTGTSEEVVVDGSTASFADAGVFFGGRENTDTTQTFSFLTDTSYPQSEDDTSSTQGQDTIQEATADAKPVRAQAPPVGGRISSGRMPLG